VRPPIAAGNAPFYVAVNTRSAKGTIEEPGRNVAQKAGSNREILSTAPAAYLKMLR